MALIRTLHAWTGAVLALALAVIGLSGAASVFRGELIRITAPEARAAAPAADTYGPALDRLEREHPGELFLINFAPYDLGVHRVYLKGGRNAFLDGDGRVVRTWTGGGRIEDLILSLHHQFLAGGRGAKLVGLIGLGALALALSGVVVWSRAWRVFSLRVWPRSARRRDLLAAHRNLGIVLALLLLAQAPTGVAMIFETQAHALLGVRPAPEPPASGVPGETPDWSRIIAAAGGLYPEAAVRQAWAPSAEGGAYVVNLRQPGDLNPKGATRVFLTAQGEVLRSDDARRLDAGGKLVNALLGLHSGEFGGLATRLLVAVLGIGLAALGLIGAWSFLAGFRRQA